MRIKLKLKTSSQKEAFMEGSFNNWNERIKMTKTKYGYKVKIDIKNDVGSFILYRFVIDGYLFCSSDTKAILDKKHGYCNILYLRDMPKFLDRGNIFQRTWTCIKNIFGPNQINDQNKKMRRRIYKQDSDMDCSC